MLRFVLAAGLVLAGGCRISLSSMDNDITGDDTDGGTGSGGRTCTVSTTSPSCIDAANQNPVTLTWLEQNVFKTSCIFSGCHDGSSSAQGKVDLRPGMSYAHLVNYASALDTTRKLVVTNDIHASYLMLMLHDFSPAQANPPGMPPSGDVGYMPQGTGGVPLCCQKLDAFERWINAGAPNN
jgi:hypothetical protein